MMRQDTSLGSRTTTSIKTKMEYTGQSHELASPHSCCSAHCMHALIITLHASTRNHSHHSTYARTRGFEKPFIPTTQQLADIILCRNTRLGDMSVFDMYVGTLMKSDTARISGVRFTSGEAVEGGSRVGSENKRCGSVFTAVMDGVSRYTDIVSWTCTRMHPTSNVTSTSRTPTASLPCR